MDGWGRDSAGGVGALRVGLLGPLDVWVGGRPVVVTASRLRTLLAVLAVSAGRVVSVHRLAVAMWDADLPGDVRGAVQTYVARLRRVLGGPLIGTSPDGYVLRVAPDRVDALRFVRLLEAAAAAQEVARERGLLAEALGLWRGMPFEGMRSGWLAQGEARRLTERYLGATERRVDLDLADGRAGELVAELTDLTARYPLRESLWVRLLVALDRCGRPAEALERYEAVRVRLAEELGADPGPELQRLHAQLLAARPPHPAPSPPPSRDGVETAVAEPVGQAPELAPVGQPLGPQALEAGRDGMGAGSWRVVPRQLPADVHGFTGRERELAGLAGLLGGGDHEGAARGPVVVSAVVGTAGVGKSALAIHAAHRVAERFPDGQLYVNLQGAAAGLEPLVPGEVLGRWLRALGVDPGAIPAEVEEAAALWRSQTAGRRLLVVVDDAADAVQVRPLLPGSPGCGVVVTSRRVLASLEGAQHLHLDVLAPTEAVQLLGRLAGPVRVAAEPEAAAEVARLCGQLPLAVRIAGGRLAARPGWPVARLAERLADAHRRLDELELAGTGVRASFTVSVEQLRAGPDPTDRSAAAAFGLLGLPDGPELGIPAAARLLDQPEQAAERVLERLADAHLVETPAPGRYRLHDLLRLYARELAQQHPRPRRAAAEQAATCPGAPAELAIQLAHALLALLWVRGHWDDLVEINQTALAVAQRTGDRAAQGLTNRDLAAAYCYRGQPGTALACLRESLAIFQELGMPRGQAESLRALGETLRALDRLEEARAHWREALAILQHLHTPDADEIRALLTAQPAGHTRQA